MIKAIGKPLEEIVETLAASKKVLIAGCGGCVTVCEAGGDKEVKVLASSLRLFYTNAGEQKELFEATVTRQCDMEYLNELAEIVDKCDAVVSLACGAGAQYMAERYKDKPVFPGVDTCFIGVNLERGVYSERCQACGKCILASTGGICPVARCSKRMLNGPCGGSEGGKCEVDKNIDCGWHLIYERLKALGQLDRFEIPVDPKDWSTSRDGGPRKIVREDIKI
ncbi:MAG: methylenetetrahydrofolate reductase C-terminal domain-containing protein [Deltaproteobacteria bacterium]|nr:methylenetetrahydrofolate reductase C-terminal domain-containing protein [Deltaproteobacteria bacterium]